MIIKGSIMYDCIKGLPERSVSIDTSKRMAACDRDVCDDVSFALYGKTVFNDLLRKEKGVPEISLTIECNGNTVYIFRKPQYLRVTGLGTEYLTDEMCSLETKDAKYDKLEPKKYYEMLIKFIDMTYDEFVSYCHQAKGINNSYEHIF